MLVLFDQCTPVPIAASLAGHLVKTARQMGWSTLNNGDLLRMAEEAGFDVLLTADNNLAYQQNLKGRRIVIVALTSNRRSNIQVVLPQIAEAVNRAVPGSYFVVEVSD